MQLCFNASGDYLFSLLVLERKNILLMNKNCAKHISTNQLLIQTKISTNYTSS